MPSLMQNMYQGLNLKLRVPLVTKNELCGCQLLLRTAKSESARGDAQNFGKCQAPVAPVLTQAQSLTIQEVYEAKSLMVATTGGPHIS